jgi:homoprotocatechuate degradation regulator HpaR
MRGDDVRDVVPNADRPPAPRRKNMAQLLLQTRERMMQRFRPVLSRFGLTEQQWRVIRILTDVETMEPRQLSRQATILGPSLVGVLDRMVRSGLVEKRRHPSDQRRLNVSLTTGGRRLYAQVWPLMEAEYQEMAEQVGDEEMRSFLEALERFNARLGPAAGEEPG